MKIKKTLKEIQATFPPEQWDRIVKDCEENGLDLHTFFGAKKERKERVHFKKLFDDQIKITRGVRRKDGTVEGIGRGGSRFYNPQAQFNTLLREQLAHGLSFQPVKTVASDGACEQLQGIALKRAVAVKYIKKYYLKNKFLWRLKAKIRKYALSEAQCDVAIKIGKGLKQAETSAFLGSA